MLKAYLNLHAFTFGRDRNPLIPRLCNVEQISELSRDFPAQALRQVSIKARSEWRGPKRWSRANSRQSSVLLRRTRCC